MRPYEVMHARAGRPAGDNNGSKIWSFIPDVNYWGDKTTGRYIRDVKVITGGSSDISCGDGWQKAPDDMKTGVARDLNYHAGGDFVYLCLRRSDLAGSFAFIYAIQGETSDAACNPGDFKVPGDLNKGAGGAFVYFCVSTDFLRMQHAYTYPPQPQGHLADVGIYVGNRSDAAAYCSHWKVGGYANVTEVDLNSGTATSGFLSTSSQPLYACGWYV